MNQQDSNADLRKQDHIDLAFSSKVSTGILQKRFFYEPMMSAHPRDADTLSLNFLGKDLNAPIWISSMTGGTAKAGQINRNLAKVCGEFKLGMGLGSCRQLLYSDAYLSDFQVRKFLNDQPLYANLGIAQMENLLDDNSTSVIKEMLLKLDADGLIIHVNPLQEWLQPEGDRFKYRPIDTICRALDRLDTKIIVKEVGQGMGIESLTALMQLPLEAIEFAASGGTNFAMLELLRASSDIHSNYQNLSTVGHSALDMTDMLNQILSTEKNILCKQVIVSGGIQDFLDGYYYMEKLQLPAVYGQASSFLKYALESYESLQQFVKMQMDGLAIAKAYLRVRE